VPLEHKYSDATHRGGPTGIAEDSPFASLDVHLDVVVIHKDGKDVAATDFDTNGADVRVGKMPCGKVDRRIF
jgi:hypothetical protein